MVYLFVQRYYNLLPKYIGCCFITGSLSHDDMDVFPAVASRETPRFPSDEFAGVNHSNIWFSLVLSPLKVFWSHFYGGGH